MENSENLQIRNIVLFPGEINIIINSLNCYILTSELFHGIWKQAGLYTGKVYINSIISLRDKLLGGGK